MHMANVLADSVVAKALVSLLAFDLSGSRLLCDINPGKCFAYGGPFLSGHSQQRPPSLMLPQFFAAASMKAFTSASH